MSWRHVDTVVNGHHNAVEDNGCCNYENDADLAHKNTSIIKINQCYSTLMITDKQSQPNY